MSRGKYLAREGPGLRLAHFVPYHPCDDSVIPDYVLLAAFLCCGTFFRSGVTLEHRQDVDHQFVCRLATRSGSSPSKQQPREVRMSSVLERIPGGQDSNSVFYMFSPPPPPAPPARVKSPNLTSPVIVEFLLWNSRRKISVRTVSSSLLAPAWTERVQEQ